MRQTAPFTRYSIASTSLAATAAVGPPRSRSVIPAIDHLATPVQARSTTCCSVSRRTSRRRVRRSRATGSLLRDLARPRRFRSRPGSWIPNLGVGAKPNGRLPLRRPLRESSNRGRQPTTATDEAGPTKQCARYLCRVRHGPPCGCTPTPGSYGHVAVVIAVASNGTVTAEE